MKPHAILPERPSDGVAELIPPAILDARSKEAPGIEHIIPEELENLAVEVVGATPE